jgi:hypothetical protein
MKPHYRKQWEERSVATILKPSLENRKDYNLSCKPLIFLERDTGLEPATFALARRRSTN